jgi:hypothetical protein
MDEMKDKPTNPATKLWQEARDARDEADAKEALLPIPPTSEQFGPDHGESFNILVGPLIERLISSRSNLVLNDLQRSLEANGF